MRFSTGLSAVRRGYLRCWLLCLAVGCAGLASARGQDQSAAVVSVNSEAAASESAVLESIAGAALRAGNWL
ncbi:MAG UNVERIFIED_CONTAM: hypothetical protein LVR18_18110 [Planctomycetaceae bacterium]|jgi:hypothetical protein